MVGHVISPRTYGTVYVALLVLLILTVALNKLPLGEWHLAAALTISVVKAALIVLYFMHVRYGTSLLRVVSAAGLLWLLLLLGLTMADVVSRGSLREPPGDVVPGRQAMSTESRSLSAGPWDLPRARVGRVGHQVERPQAAARCRLRVCTRIFSTNRGLQACASSGAPPGKPGFLTVSDRI